MEQLIPDRVVYLFLISLDGCKACPRPLAPSDGLNRLSLNVRLPSIERYKSHVGPNDPQQNLARAIEKCNFATFVARASTLSVRHDQNQLMHVILCVHNFCWQLVNYYRGKRGYCTQLTC